MSSSRDRARDGRSRRPRHSRRRRSSAFAGAAVLAASLLPAATARAEIRITLQNGFVEKYKDRATIDATYSIDNANARPKPPAGDGDFHAAGRAPEVGLAAVASVMNAALEPKVLELVHRAERSRRPVAVRGVWRLWCEHGGDSEHVQGQPIEPFKTTNPPHVFAIHPVLRFGDQDLAGSFQPIDGFSYKDAGQAFRNYEQLPSRITVGEGTTTITTRMADADYVDFVIRLNEDPTDWLADGLAVKAAVLDTQGELLVDERRMIAVAGTAPYARVKALRKGEALHVVGVPRIDLALLSRRIADSGRVAGILDWSLPYEMVLVAVFTDTPSGPDLTPAASLPGTADTQGPAGAVVATGTPAAGAAAATAGAAVATGAPAAVGASGAPAARPGGARAVPIEPLAPAVPAVPANLPESDVVAILLQLLGDTAPPGAVRGACTLSSRQSSYCARLTSPQCNQLGGAFNAGKECPPATPVPRRATPDPAPGATAPDPPAPPAAVSGRGSRS
jgi:hypothetical protein